MGNQQERSLGWLAGIIDGEGTISVQVYTLPSGRVRITPFIAVVNTDDGILTETMTILTQLLEGKEDGKPRFCRYIKRENKRSFEGRKPCHTIRVDGVGVKHVLVPLIPHLRSVKKEAAVKILEFLESRSNRLISRDALGRIQRQGYTQYEVELISSVRTSNLAKSSEAICRASNVMLE